MQSLRKLISSLYPAAALMLIFTLLVSFNSYAAPKKKFVVVIDAGHGGSDHGAIENGLNEKDITLSVALKLGEMIKKKLKDTEVVYTRSEDKFISLQKRADIANKAKADLFVSIHCNSVDRSNKNRANVVGATTYVLGHHKDNDNLEVARRENAVVELDADDSTHFSQFDPSSDESHIIFEMTQKKNFQNSIRFASDVQREMASAGRVSRGVQQAGFWVLWSTAAPAALIELDFICNPEQARFLNSKEGQDKLAGAIFNAVKNYENYFRMSLGMPSSDKKADAKKSARNEDKEGAEEPIREEAVLVASVDLPESPSTSKKKSHRQEASSSTREVRKDDSNHRRRSSKAREEGGSKIEEVNIVLTEELALASSDVRGGEVKDFPSPGSETSKSDKSAKKKTSATRPGRRDKDKKTGRRGVKQSVKVDYRILLFVSDDELQGSDEAFRGLTPVAAFRENNQYKYTYGESADRKEMEALLKDVTPLFPEARVIKCYY